MSYSVEVEFTFKHGDNASSPLSEAVIYDIRHFLHRMLKVMGFDVEEHDRQFDWNKPHITCDLNEYVEAEKTLFITLVMEYEDLSCPTSKFTVLGIPVFMRGVEEKYPDIRANVSVEGRGPGVALYHAFGSD